MILLRAPESPGKRVRQEASKEGAAGMTNEVELLQFLTSLQTSDV